MEGKLYFGGMSTDTELKKLMDAYGEAAPGTFVSHEEVAGVIGSAYGTSRYRTVVARWRNAMFVRNNLELAARPGEGYMVLSAPERVQRASDAFRRVGDRLRRVHGRFAAIPRADLSAEDARRADHAQIAAARLCDELASARKKIAPPPPTQHSRTPPRPIEVEPL